MVKNCQNPRVEYDEGWKVPSTNYMIGNKRKNISFETYLITQMLLQVISNVGNESQALTKTWKQEWGSLQDVQE